MIEVELNDMFRTTNPAAKFHPINQTERAILDECNRLADMLIKKNRAYGNSALEPINIFSKLSAEEQIYSRLDDKISRIKNGHEYPGDDTVLDIAGYLVLLMILRGTGDSR